MAAVVCCIYFDDGSVLTKSVFFLGYLGCVYGRWGCLGGFV